VSAQDAPHSLSQLYGDAVGRLQMAMQQDDSQGFHAALEELRGRRATDVRRELRSLATTLHDAVLRFRQDFHVADMAEHDVPDARARLNYVLELTDAAAHRTLDLIEQCGPLAERITGAAEDLRLALDASCDSDDALPSLLQTQIEDFLAVTSLDCGAIRNNLSQVMLAQSYQDLTGQIIRGVVTLVSEVETVLAQLLEMTGSTGRTGTWKRPDQTAISQSFGPAIPGVSRGVVANQGGVDDLMADLGL
jgi:chemotaxis protein CheZ